MKKNDEYTIKLLNIILKYQEENKHVIVGRAFTKYICIACEKEKEHSNTGVPHICPECAKQLNN